MIKIRPFKAFRPTRDKVNLVASRSYLTYSDETIKEKLNHNPYTFLHIINPDYICNKKSTGINKFQRVKEKFYEFVNEGILQKDKIASYYIYQKSNKQNTFTGIISSVSVKDYTNNNIKKHEQTLCKREKMFCDYLNTTGFNAEPVLLCYKPNHEINTILKKYTDSRPEYEFTTTNRALHKLWLVNTPIEIKKITNAFNKIASLYIADGHHRCASSALLAKQKKSKASQYFMSYLIDEDQINILNFNRLIKSLNKLTLQQFLNKIKQNYTISKKQEKEYTPSLHNEISMYIDKNWYSLIPNKENYNSISESLDPAILSRNILKPILNIFDERTDKNISFLNGSIPLSTIKEKIDNREYAVAFILKPISMFDIKQVADNNETLPPKSTYVEPKLRSGMTIYPIE